MNKQENNADNQPKKWKMALLSWLCNYPLLNILFFLLMPYIGHLNSLLKTLILVPLMGIILGLLQKRLYSWLRH